MSSNDGNVPGYPNPIFSINPSGTSGKGTIPGSFGADSTLKLMIKNSSGFNIVSPDELLELDKPEDETQVTSPGKNPAKGIEVVQPGIFIPEINLH